MTPDLRPRKQPRQERARQTVERILDTAAEVFSDRGYPATTNDIADAARISIGSLYQYFPNKDALLVALAERHVEQVSSVVELHAADLDRAELTLEQLVGDMIDLVVGLHEADRLHILLAHQAPRTTELQHQLELALGRIVAVIADLLVDVAPHVRVPHLTAHLLVAMVDAAVHDVVITRASPEERHAAIERMVELVLGALAPG